MTTKNEKPVDPWYVTYFQEHGPFFGEIPAQTTRIQTRYLMKKLRLTPGKSFLDCPCGQGRISIPLARAGIKVTGVDLSAQYVEELAKTAARRKLRIETVCSDMRTIGFTNQFDAAANLWTSFGYFEADRDNLLVVKKIFQALKPGGRFCLHVMNRDWIIAHYVQKNWMMTEDWLHLQERHLDLATSLHHGVWTFYKDGKSVTYKTTIRLYSLHELVAIFREVGFVEIEGFSSTRDMPITRDTMMNWVFGVKPR